MKSWKYNIILVLVIGLWSCKKEVSSTSKNNHSLLKVVNVDESYQARDIIELPDGSMLIMSVALFKETDISFTSPATTLPAIMTKYEPDGTLEWQLELPEVVQVPWHCILLSTGNIIVVGLNSESGSQQIGVVLMSPFGTVLKQLSFFNAMNIITQNGGRLSSVDCTELTNGNIALAMPSNQSSSLPNMVRLVIYTPDLIGLVLDRFYSPDNIVLRRNVSQLSIEADAFGDVLIHGRDPGYNNDVNKYFAFTLKVDGQDYNPIYNQLFWNETISSPSNFSIANNGSLVWASANSNPEDSLFIPWFNTRNQELYAIGSTITIWKTDGDFNNTVLANFSGFPKNAYVSRIIKCSDGGYLLFGTCNINSNQNIPSDYQLMLVKISESLGVEWIQFPKTNDPTIAGDISEISTGYLISATHLSFEEYSVPILFKTDKNGILKQ